LTKAKQLHGEHPIGERSCPAVLAAQPFGCRVPRFLPPKRLIASSIFNLVGLVKPNHHVTTDAGGQVDLGLQVEFDADQRGSVLELALVVDGAIQQVACSSKVSGQSGKGVNFQNVPTGPLAQPEMPGMGRLGRASLVRGASAPGMLFRIVREGF
jgi:hypothetical protein